MRLIDADALFDCVYDKYGESLDEGPANMFMGLINEAPTMWIPVTEKLPAENGNYIVTACDEGSPAGKGIWYSTVMVVAEYYGGSWTWYDGY